MLAIAVAGFAAGCGLLEEEEPGTPAPVGESNSAGMFPSAGTAAVGTSTGSGSTAASSSDGADTTVGPPDLGMDVLMLGVIDIGDGAWTTPLPCVLRIFLDDQLDPETGIAMEWEAEIPLVIEAFPYMYMVTRDDVPATIDYATEGYVGVRCDFDGDRQLDNVGAFYPELPAQLVTLPADSVDMALQFL